LTPPTLTTGRLILRAYRRSDFESFAAMVSEPEFIRYLGNPSTKRVDIWDRFTRHIGMWELMGFGFFAIEERATGAHVGEVGFQERKREIRPSIEGTLETGWGLFPSAQGKGYATEAATAALAWVEDAFPGLRQTAIIDSENHASIRLAERLGFREFARTLYQETPLVLFERGT
jgi:RimJ/RimL family protein N-acetyltransferase